nr:hypothetical protein [Tanacetum cinerariifolium]
VLTEVGFELSMKLLLKSHDATVQDCKYCKVLYTVWPMEYKEARSPSTDAQTVLVWLLFEHAKDNTISSMGSKRTPTASVKRIC